MTREQFKVLVKAMKAVYTNPGFIPDQNAFDVWYSMLKDLDYTIASRAVQMHLQTEESPPTVAGIRKQSAKLKADETDDLNETAAWALVLKAMRRAAYYAEEEFEKLPAVVKRAVFSPGQLREWAILEDIDGKTMTVIQANFQRTFRNEMRIEKEKEKLSPDVLKLYSKNDSKKVETSKREVSQIEENDNEKDTVEAPDDIMERVIRRMERE